MASKATKEMIEATDTRTSELLDSLEEIVLTEGFARLTVGEMASQLRCSRRTIYELAKSKNELVLLVLERFFRKVRTDAEQAIADIDDPARRIYEYLQVGVKAAHRFSPILVRDIDKWPPSRRVWEEHIRARVDGLRQLVEDGIRQGVFRDVHAELVAETMFASINRIREPSFYNTTNLTIYDAFREFYGMILHALDKTGDKPANKGARRG
jgi:AcrR family transcriptional regulator